MEAVPSAVWLDGETAAPSPARPGQADADSQQVRSPWPPPGWRTRPDLRRYNIPGRDCSSTRRAPTDADYDAWINAIGGALGNAKAVVLEEPDSLADLPGYCGAAYAAEFPDITNTTRVGDVAYAVHAGGGPEHQPLPRRREQRLAERRRHGRDADRRGRPAVAGLLPQRLQLPVPNSDTRHLGVGVHRLRDRNEAQTRPSAGGGGYVPVPPSPARSRPGLSPDVDRRRLATQSERRRPGTNIA